MAKAAQKVEEQVVETKPELEMTAVQKKAVDGLPSVSARIRYLAGEGYSRSDITKLIPNASGGKLRYQHVRNVLEQKLVGDKS